MSALSITEVYEMLSDKMGKETAKHLTLYIETTIDEKVSKATTPLATREQLTDKLAETKIDLIKWMFAFWISQFAAILFYILKK